MRSPISWIGGKARLASSIVKLLSYNKAITIYAEPFGGGASVLIAKPKHPIEVYNDRHEGLTALFECLSDAERFGQFYGRVILHPYSRAMFERARDRWQMSANVVERAAAFFIVFRQSFGGNATSWGYSMEVSPRADGEKSVLSFLHTLDDLPRLHERLRGVIVENNDWARVMDAYDTPQTIWYCDSPYVPETRSGKSYAHELTMADHQRLVARLLALKGRALLSGYPHAIYEPLEASGWRRLEWDATCTCSGHTRANAGSEIDTERTEAIWVDPRLPLSGAQIAAAGARLAHGRADDSLF